MFVSPRQERTDSALVNFQNLKKGFSLDVLRKMTNTGVSRNVVPESEHLSLMPSAVLQRTPRSNLTALSSSGKRLPDLNSHTRESFLAGKMSARAIC